MTRQYKYKTLAGDDIRLLSILPDKGDNSRIRCRLFEYTLNRNSRQPHPYEALSYVWGSQDKTRSVSIGTLSLSVTPALHNALIHLRHHALPRIIWVDGICINQTDDQEKAEQVGRMYEVYACASSVIVWLGEQADNSDQALEAIRRAASEKAIDLADNQSINRDIIRLLQRRWFRRIWVRSGNSNL